MNIDLMLAIIFYALLILYIAKNKKKFQFHGKIFAMYKTSLGLKLMDRMAKKFPRTLSFLGIVSIITGFLGMAFIFYWLVKGTFDLLFTPNAVSAVAPILPGIKVIPGLPVLSFVHWIIAILVIAVIHEFSHGIFARLYDVKVKSSGWAIFGPILAAFVEPDEKQLTKKSKKVQLAVFSAGPFSNILTGFVFIAIMSFVTFPMYNEVYTTDGVIVNELIDGFPMKQTGIDVPFTISRVNGEDTNNLQEFSNATAYLTPGDEIILSTDKGEFSVTAAENPEDSSKGFMGISSFELVRVPNQEIVEKYGAFLPPLVEWTHMLIFWLWVVSWGVGLFNLLPLGPVDGGRMLYSGLLALTKNEKKSKKYWALVSWACVILIFINLAPFLWKLLLWILKPVIFILTKV
ncbi:MAG: site-2 protease family protein [Nanoarchaeota archaeon]|nr:site-2 protease family protein [Nanoarchaeota archaeon]